MTALVLDCDGVLADTEKDGHRAAFNQTFREMGLPVQWSVEEYGSLLSVGGGKERLRTLLQPTFVRAARLPRDPELLEEQVARWHRRKSEIYQDLVARGAVPARPGVARLVREALESGWRVGIASTSAENSVRAVAQHVLGVDVATQVRVFAGDMVAAKKPAPDIYLAAATGLDSVPSECVAVEDSTIGCTAAVAAGLTCVVTESEYTSGDDFPGASLVLSSLGGPGQPVRVLRNPSALDVPAVIDASFLETLRTRGRPRATLQRGS